MSVLEEELELVLPKFPPYLTALPPHLLWLLVIRPPYLAAMHPSRTGGGIHFLRRLLQCSRGRLESCIDYLG